MPNDGSADKKKDELSSSIIPTLRVAEQELHSSKGRVFVQLSPGAVAFSMDRNVAQARVSRKLHQAMEHEEDKAAATANKKE